MIQTHIANISISKTEQKACWKLSAAHGLLRAEAVFAAYHFGGEYIVLAQRYSRIFLRAAFHILVADVLFLLFNKH